MTEIILNFPARNVRARNVAPLRCVWIETGDPSQPLVCKWVRCEQSDAARSAEITGEPHVRRLCA